MNYVNDIKIIKSIEDSGLLIDGVTEAVKHEIKNTRSQILGALLAPLDASLVEPVIYSVIKGASGRGAGKAGKGYMDKSF